jgi:phospholipid N-methyltransferase
MSYTATYSPDDNKLRLYASSRLDANTFARVKAEGFKWAPKQELFVAPMWTPNREDLLLELAGEIDDEDTSLVDRAAERAERFEEYRDRRAADADRAHKAVAVIADNIPFGQPILVGHHSERHARRDAEKIRSGMDRAIKLWDTSQYWKSRAAGALRAAKYKELPTVRARRIKTIEAEQRKRQREKKDAEMWLAAWSIKDLTLEQARKIANVCHLSVIKRNDGFYWHAYDVLRPDGERYDACPTMTVEQVQDAAKRAYPRTISYSKRWIAHYENRLLYEKVMLDEQGASDLIVKKPRPTQMPMLNYRGQGGFIKTQNRWNLGQIDTLPQIEMTSAEYGAISGDYKGTSIVENSHRIRVAHVKHARVAVFITDRKTHKKPPIAEKPAPKELPELSGHSSTCGGARIIPEGAKDMVALTLEETDVMPKEVTPEQANGAQFDAMRASLKAGVQTVSAPQLFPTPQAIAMKMVEIAEIEPGHKILEPSAGTGAILDQIISKNAEADFFAVELNHRLAESLATKYYWRGTREDGFCRNVLQGDFLECAGNLGQFDRVIMNPPFENGSDIVHIMHARTMLAPGGRLVALCANGPRQQGKLKPIASKWHDLPAGSFEAQGTRVNVALLVIEA